MDSKGQFELSAFGNPAHKGCIIETLTYGDFSSVHDWLSVLLFLDLTFLGHKYFSTYVVYYFRFHSF